MDLKQSKLSKLEWDNTEIPVSPQELEILRLIIAGYDDVSIRINKTPSLISYLKIEPNPAINQFLFNRFFTAGLRELFTKNNIPAIDLGSDTIVRLKSADQIRLSKISSIDENTTDIYEFTLFKLLQQLCGYYEVRVSAANKDWMQPYYTLSQLIKNQVSNLNATLLRVITGVLELFEPSVDLMYIIEKAPLYIEKNTNLIKYTDLCLYEHQKRAITISKMTKREPTGPMPFPKLVLYIAPTGTGKTLTPLALSCGHKIIFVCAARHVGLALAKSAISINKRIAFAFGCSSADDIRLHYFAAKSYSVNKRTGRIKKVDNSVGDKVEIMICDVRSYLYAMYYMLAFNLASNIITYWDEPTMTLDYPDHPLHKVIKKNWKENMIPTVYLSSSTLPKETEMYLTISDFKTKFTNGEVFNIISHDCRKSIPMIDPNGYVVMPHYLSDQYYKILEFVAQCESNLTLLRYFDLKEASEFILYVLLNDHVNPSAKIERTFANVDDITMTSLKMYYLKVLKGIRSQELWPSIYSHFQLARTCRITQNTFIDPRGNAGADRIKTVHNAGDCGVYVTTKDAYTLTDGPTIFLANDVHKIAKFCIQQSNIPENIMKSIMDKIEHNNNVNAMIYKVEGELDEIEKKMADKMASGAVDTGKKNNKSGKSSSKVAMQKINNNTENGTINALREQLNILPTMIKTTSLNDIFVPNKLAHCDKWAKGLNTRSAFTSRIDDDIMVRIMMLPDIDSGWKILLLLGIGVFTNHNSQDYTEIMKEMADKQMLYLIIADSDYIYGTNYQFCHGYISKDLTQSITQEKLVQSMGRIGRGNIQQDYTVRFRDNIFINILFTQYEATDKPEVINMNQLFNSQNVKWNGTSYEEIITDDLDLDENEMDDENDNETSSDDEEVEDK